MDTIRDFDADKYKQFYVELLMDILGLYLQRIVANYNPESFRDILHSDVIGLLSLVAERSRSCRSMFIERIYPGGRGVLSQTCTLFYIQFGRPPNIGGKIEGT